jgi:hypothetical protein
MVVAGRMVWANRVGAGAMSWARMVVGCDSAGVWGGFWTVHTLGGIWFGSWVGLLEGGMCTSQCPQVGVLKP